MALGDLTKFANAFLSTPGRLSLLFDASQNPKRPATEDLNHYKKGNIPEAGREAKYVLEEMRKKKEENEQMAQAQAGQGQISDEGGAPPEQESPAGDEQSPIPTSQGQDLSREEVSKAKDEIQRMVENEKKKKAVKKEREDSENYVESGDNEDEIEGQMGTKK